MCPIIARKHANTMFWIGCILWLSLFCNYIGGLLSCLASMWVYFTTLCITVMHCTALHCSVLHCTELNCTGKYTGIHSTALHCKLGVSPFAYQQTNYLYRRVTPLYTSAFLFDIVPLLCKSHVRLYYRGTIDDLP